MSSRQSSIRTVHTATVTPALREARKYMSLVGILLMVFSLWLVVGLLFCSVNPELSTSTDHILGSVTHYICSSLINYIGLVSLSLSLIFMRLGSILWSVSIPQLHLRDALIYIGFIFLTATQLQITLGIDLMGAPIGGQIGVYFSQILIELGPYASQAIVCSGLFGLLGLQMWLNQKENIENASLPPEKWITEVHRGAQPVKSLNSLQQRAHTHVFGEVTELPPEFDHESRRFEAVESFYDDLDGQQEDKEGKPKKKSIFLDDLSVLDEPRFTFDNRAIDEDYEASSLEEELTPSFTLRSQEMNPVGERISTPNPRLTSVNHTPTNLTYNRTPIEQLSQSLNPKVSRKTILQRAFDSLQLTLALTQSESGNVADCYEFVSPISPPMPLYEITERLNTHIRRSLGRSEPPVLLTMQNKNNSYVIEATWPRRDRKFTETTEAMKVIRDLEAKGELTLFLGEMVNGKKALTPFGEINSVMITAGEKVEQDRGLDLIITNLIYQAPPPKLRLLILDIAAERSPYATLPHLYSPIVSEADQMTSVLRWLPIELRRRRSQMTKANVLTYDALLNKYNEAEPRLILVIPELSHLDNEQHKLLIAFMEKQAQLGIETGIHIVVNSRIFGERCAHFVRFVDMHIAFATDTLEEARGFGISGAEWLLPQNDILVKTKPNNTLRVHSWLLSSNSYQQILSVLSRASQQVFINPYGDFLSTKALKAQSKRQYKKRQENRRSERSSQKTSSTNISRLQERVTESSLPPV